MGFEFSDGIKRGGASCCEVVYMGCEFEVVLKDDTQYLQSFNLAILGNGGGGSNWCRGRKMIISLDLELFKVR